MTVIQPVGDVAELIDYIEGAIGVDLVDGAEGVAATERFKDLHSFTHLHPLVVLEGGGGVHRRQWLSIVRSRTAVALYSGSQAGSA